MSETSGVIPAWVPYLHRMDEIWVPTPFNAKAFERALHESSKTSKGIPKVTVIPEPLDIDFFDPKKSNRHPFFDLSQVNKLYHEMLDRKKQAGQSVLLSEKRKISHRTSILLSVFSWDIERKGKQILVTKS